MTSLTCSAMLKPPPSRFYLSGMQRRGLGAIGRWWTDSGPMIGDHTRKSHNDSWISSSGSPRPISMSAMV
jgi:hypothetical protein